LHDATEAYRWYFVSYATEGYSTQFRNVQNGSGYCGAVGDFRNETVVSELVDKLGFDRIRQIDVEAEAWLSAHPMRFTDPRDHRTT
jgi:hypothetical protein